MHAATSITELTLTVIPDREKQRSIIPTTKAYSELQSAFDILNSELFNGKLPYCLITLARHPRSLGYFSPDRFGLRRGNGSVHEIAINPQYLRTEPVISTLATIAHEMCHLWQQDFGRPSRGGYHNREFAEQMKSIGLQPSSTGAPGGAETGQNMSDYPIACGPFERVANAMIAAGFEPSFFDRNEPTDREHTIHFVEGEPADRPVEFGTPGLSGKRQKYKCVSPACRVAVWGRPALKIICGECGTPFVATR